MIILLVFALIAAAAWQLSLAADGDRGFPGPGPGTPLPTGVSTAAP